MPLSRCRHASSCTVWIGIRRCSSAAAPVAFPGGSERLNHAAQMTPQGDLGPFGVVGADGGDDFEMLGQRHSRTARLHGEPVLVPHDLSAHALNDLVGCRLPADLTHTGMQSLVVG